MLPIRKIPIHVIPMIVMLAGCACLFFAFFVITSNTANILAWGFDGISHLEKSSFSLFIYELAHTTFAYPGLLLGLLLVGLAAIILFIYGSINERQARKIFWMIWATGFISFIICNVTLMLLPAPSYFPKYLHMMFTHPDPDGSYHELVIDPYRYWPFALPAVIAILLLIINSFTISSRIQAVTQTLPLFAISPVLTFYLSRHYLCFENPDTYSLFLNILTPILILAPVTAFIFFTRRSCGGILRGRF